MGQLKKKLLFFGLSLSAYTSPVLMIISLFTNHWLSSSEVLIIPTAKEKQTTTPSSYQSAFFTKNVAGSRNMTTKVFIPLDHLEANYGLWEMCKITGRIDKHNQKYVVNVKQSVIGPFSY
jgi:hypothetical protein